jgi:mono/diheme cytochrome c family protein
MRTAALTTAVILLLILSAAPLPATPAGGSEGQRLYQRHCASCHGTSGRGDGPDASPFVAKPRNLREGFLQLYSTEDVTRRIRDGRILRLERDADALRQRNREVKALLTYMQELPRMDWSVVEKGWELYVARCETCHGMYGRPAATPPEDVPRTPDLSDPDVQEALGDVDLITAVRHGRPGMPSLSPRISETQALQLATFVRRLSPGFTLYTHYCAACHGEGGRGVGSYGEAIHRPAVVFDRRYFAQSSVDGLRQSIWHMLSDHKPSMPHFRWSITQKEGRKIVEYIKGLP